MMWTRRRFVSAVGASAASALFSSSPSAAPLATGTGAKGRVVVVGGGMAGAAAAKYLRLWGGADVDVTLVDRAATYQSCILSNLVLNGSVSMSSLQFQRTALTQNYGVKLVTGDVLDIDPDGRTVTVASGTTRTPLKYDRLVLAPGIEFDVLPGLETASAQALAPHAWKAGDQTTQLRRMIQAMQPGHVFIMTIPAAPYRCPPGPYERACVVADYLKRQKPGAKVIVLDANPAIVAERTNFTNAFENIHRGVIEYVPSAVVDRVDTATMTIKTTMGDFKGNVLNPIPPHRAGSVVSKANLANVAGRWAGVNVLSYESVVPYIHVIGDSCGTTQPKAGHIGNQEGKVCADAIVRLLAGFDPDPAPVTNSACYSPITATTASWLTAVFAYDSQSRTMKAVPASSGEASGPSGDNYEQMFKWFRTLMADTFA